MSTGASDMLRRRGVRWWLGSSSNRGGEAAACRAGSAETDEEDQPREREHMDGCERRESCKSHDDRRV